MTKPLSEMTRSELVDACIKGQQRSADLAAHVERLRFTLIDAKRCVAVTAYPRLYTASQYKGLAKRVMRRIEEVGKEAPATSLAHIKAQFCRDVVDRLAEEFREAWPEHNGKHAWILGAGDSICRQAEGDAQ